MRRGELLGLKRADVDLENATVRVRRTLTRKGTGYVLGEPKTKQSPVSITLDTYSHMLPGMGGEAAKAMSEVLS